MRVLLPYPPLPPPRLQVTSQPITWTNVRSFMRVISPQKCTIGSCLITHRDCGCLNGLIFRFFYPPLKKITTKQKNAKCLFCWILFSPTIQGPVYIRWASLVMNCRCVCMRKGAGWLACRDRGCSSRDITKRASPPLHIKTTTTLTAEPVGKSGQPEWLTELAHPIQTCILYCITQMALM